MAEFDTATVESHMRAYSYGWVFSLAPLITETMNIPGNQEAVKRMIAIANVKLTRTSRRKLTVEELVLIFFLNLLCFARCIAIVKYDTERTA